MCQYSSRGAYSAINSTNVVDSAHGPELSAVPSSPPPEAPQSANASHLHGGVIDALYRQYGPSLTQLAPTNLQASIRLRCTLKDPKGYQPDQKVVIRREKRVVLELYLQLDGGRIRDMQWQGIALPRTGSVKQSNQSAPTRLLHLSIKVHGSTTGMLLTEPCDKCWRREMRALGDPRDLPQYLIDFKSSRYALFLLLPLLTIHGSQFQPVHSLPERRDSAVCQGRSVVSFHLLL